MAEPVIDTRTSLQIVDKGGSIDYRPVATNSPTSWSADPVPDGMTFDATNGRLRGNPTEAGLHQVLLRAINADGFDEIVLLIPVLETGSTIGQNDITLEMNVDVLTGKVTFLGAEGATWGPPVQNPRNDGLKAPLLLVKKGDRFPVAIGFTRNGVLQDLPIDNLRLGSKEFVTEGLLDLTDGTFVPIGEGASKRYVVTLVVGDNVWKGVVSNYEDDAGTYVDSHSEVQFSLVRQFGYDAVDKTNVDNLTAAGSSSHTLNFNDLPPDDGTYTLVLSIERGDEDPTTLTKKYDLTYGNGTFAISDQDDPITHRDRYDITYEFSVDIDLSTTQIQTDGDITGTRGEVFRLYSEDGAYEDYIPVGSHTSQIGPHLPGNASYLRGSNDVTRVEDADGNFVRFNIEWNTSGFWGSDDLGGIGRDFQGAMGYSSSFSYVAERIDANTLRLRAFRKRYRVTTPDIDTTIVKPPRAGYILDPDGTRFDFTDLQVDVEVIPASNPTPTNVTLAYSDDLINVTSRISSVEAVANNLAVKLYTVSSLVDGGGEYGSGGGSSQAFKVSGKLTAPKKNHDAFVKTSETFILRASGDLIEEDNQDL